MGEPTENYPIPGCDAWVSLPEGASATVFVDGDLTLADLRWLVAEMERRLGKVVSPRPGLMKDRRAVKSLHLRSSGLTWKAIGVMMGVRPQVASQAAAWAKRNAWFAWVEREGITPEGHEWQAGFPALSRRYEAVEEQWLEQWLPAEASALGVTLEGKEQAP